MNHWAGAGSASNVCTTAGSRRHNRVYNQQPPSDKDWLAPVVAIQDPPKLVPIIPDLACAVPSVGVQEQLLAGREACQRLENDKYRLSCFLAMQKHTWRRKRNASWPCEPVQLPGEAQPYSIALTTEISNRYRINALQLRLEKTKRAQVLDPVAETALLKARLVREYEERAAKAVKAAQAAEAGRLLAGRLNEAAKAAEQAKVLEAALSLVIASGCFEKSETLSDTTIASPEDAEALRLAG